MPPTLVRASVTDGVFAAGALLLAVVVALVDPPFPDVASGIAALAVAVALAAVVAIRTNRRIPTEAADLGRLVSVQRSVAGGAVLLVLVGATSLALLALVSSALGAGMLALTGVMALTRSAVVVTWERRQNVLIVDDPDDARRYAAVPR